METERLDELFEIPWIRSVSAASTPSSPVLLGLTCPPCAYSEPQVKTEVLPGSPSRGVLCFRDASDTVSKRREQGP